MSAVTVPPAPPPLIPMAVRIAPLAADTVGRLAARRGCRRSDVLRDAVTAYLDQIDPEETTR